MTNVAIAPDLDRIDTSLEFALGQNFTDDDGKVYKYIQYEAATAAVDGVAGEFTYYYLAGGAQDFVVTSDLSDSVNIGAGVLQAALTDGDYGWIQVQGPALLTIALTAGADGNALTPVGSTDGSLDVSALVTDHIAAIADDISAKEVIVTCPL